MFRRLVLFISLFTASVALAQGINMGNEHPVRWTSLVPIKSVADIDHQMQVPVDMSQSGGELELTDAKGKRVKVTTCQEYGDLKDKGLAPQTTYDISMESWFIDVCKPLQFLKIAKPSKSSFVSKFDLKDDPLSNLPIELGLWLSGDAERAVQLASARGTTWGQYVPDAKVEAAENDQIVVKSKKDDSATYINLIAWGDFNGDGIEDVLLQVSHHVLSGSYGDHGFRVLTRLGEGQRLKVTETF